MGGLKFQTDDALGAGTSIAEFDFASQFQELVFTETSQEIERRIHADPGDFFERYHSR